MGYSNTWKAVLYKKKFSDTTHLNLSHRNYHTRLHPLYQSHLCLSYRYSFRTKGYFTKPSENKLLQNFYLHSNGSDTQFPCLFTHLLQNTPNDLQLLSDAPAHHLFVLVPPTRPDAAGLPEILAVIQVCTACK